MKKLTPKGIIGLSTTAFLFLILMSIIYLNNQVEFNPIEAKWELQEQYKVSDSTSIITTSMIQVPVNIMTNVSTSTKSSGLKYIQSRGGSSSYYFEVEQGKTYYVFSSGDRPSFHIFDNIPQINDEYDDSIYSDYTYDYIFTSNKNGYAFKDYSRSTTLPQVYVETESTFIITEPGIDTYQVFENIRNNASTVNPLGFMNTIVSVPARAVGYYNTFVDFVTGGLGLNFRDMTFSDLGDNWWVKFDLFISKFNNPEIYGDPWDRWRD